MSSCPSCGYRGRFRLKNPGRIALAITLWIIPLGFLSQGLWPFGLFPTLLFTIWAFYSNNTVCPSCGHSLDDAHQILKHESHQEQK